MSMVRKQVFITAEQNRLLKAHARATGQPEAELIRAALDRELGADVAGDDWKRRMMACAGSLADADDLETTVARNRERWSRRSTEIVSRLKNDD